MGAKFDKLEAKLSGEKGVTDPGGLAAAIGRKKYGKENYDKAAAKDKSPKMKKSDWDEFDEMAEEVMKAKEKLEKVGVKASPNLWGKPPKPRGVGIYGKEGGAGKEMKKGGLGSGKRGHKTADYGGIEGGAFGGGPASDSKREIDPEKKKKILASDKKAVRSASKDLSHEELQSKIDSHKDLSESEHLSPASRESYAAKHKALLAVQKKKGPKPEAPAAEGISSRPGPFGNINKGGAGSGRKGHMGVTPDKTQRERNRQKAGDALQTSKDAKRIISELGLDKEDLKELRDYASAEGITPSQFIVNNKDHIKTNLKKGGPGSGKKGHKTSGKIEPKHFEPNANLRDKNKDLDRLTPEQSAERKRKKEEAQKQARKERLKERADAAHKAGNHKEYEKLISQVRSIDPYKGDPAAEGNKASREDASGTTDLDQVYGDTGKQDKSKGDTRKLDLEQMRGGVPSMHERKKMSKYKGDPAAEGNKASRQDASGTRPKSDLGKSEIELEIDELSKTMEFATMNPVEEIKKAVMELGPEGLRKAMPNMSEENKELLNDILEDMSKSHTLPLDPPKKLVNVGGENYVEEDVGNDDADEDVFDAAVKEGDNEQKHQGGSHDLTQPIDWEGQMIKSLDEFTADELATFGEVYKAMKMKKEGKEELEKVSASPKLWGSTKPRGVGIYKGEDDSVAEKVDEVEGKAKLNEVMDDTPEDKKDDVLRELREKKMKKAKELIKAALKKECPDMMDGKDELEKQKIKKALMSVLSEEYSDEEIEKAMNKADEEAKPEIKVEIEAPKEEAKEEKKEEAEDVAMEKKMKKAAVLFAKSKELLNEGEKEIATEIFIKAKKMVADVLEMNSGIKKLSQPEPASDAKTTADAVKSPKMAKSIKWYGEENDAFKAGRLGRHSYASSVNSYYDDMIKKSEEVIKEEEVKKSFNPHDVEDLIEADLMKSHVQIQSDLQMEEFKKSQGSFTRKSFEETDLLKSLGITKEEAEKL